MTLPEFVQWTGCGFGILGALLLALKNRFSGYGFVFFLASNGFWLAYGLLTNAPGLVVMQIAFSVTSGIGIWRWLVAPPAVSPMAQSALPDNLPAERHER